MDKTIPRDGTEDQVVSTVGVDYTDRRYNFSTHLAYDGTLLAPPAMLGAGTETVETLDMSEDRTPPLSVIRARQSAAIISGSDTVPVGPVLERQLDMYDVPMLGNLSPQRITWDQSQVQHPWLVQNRQLVEASFDMIPGQVAGSVQSHLVPVNLDMFMGQVQIMEALHKNRQRLLDLGVQSVRTDLDSVSQLVQQAVQHQLQFEDSVESPLGQVQQSLHLCRDKCSSVSKVWTVHWLIILARSSTCLRD